MQDQYLNDIAAEQPAFAQILRAQKDDCRGIWLPQLTEIIGLLAFLRAALERCTSAVPRLFAANVFRSSIKLFIGQNSSLKGGDVGLGTLDSGQPRAGGA